MSPTESPGERGQLVGVLLAAGGGSRMGGPKAVQSVAGRPLVIRAATVMMRGGCDRLIVVAGAAGEDVARLVMAERDLIGTHPEVVTNHDWESGMASSVRAGLLAAAQLEAGAVLIHLVDLPDVGPEVIARLRDRWTTEGLPKHAWVAAYDGDARNPVLLTGALIPDVLGSMHGDHGARGWLDANPDHVTTVECGDVGSGEDLDTRQDVRAWLVRHPPDAQRPEPQ